MSPTASDDAFVPEKSVEAFKEALDKAKVSYKFESFPGVVHSFTVPGADKIGMKGMKYDKAADEKSWKEMLALFKETLGSSEKLPLSHRTPSRSNPGREGVFDCRRMRAMSTPATPTALRSPDRQRLASSPPAVRKRRTRWIKVLVAILILVALWCRGRADGHRQDRAAKPDREAFAADLNGSIEIGAASLGWFSSIELRDVTLTDSRGRTVARIPKVTSSRTLLGLLRDRSNAWASSCSISRSVEVVCEPNTTNLEEVLSEVPRG